MRNTRNHNDDSAWGPLPSAFAAIGVFYGFLYVLVLIAGRLS